MEEDERSEELSTISAIYPELVIDEDNPYHVTLDLDVAPREPFRARFISAEDQVSESTLTYLPPLRLDLTLNKGYPDEKPPDFSISTLHGWLPLAYLEKFRARLEQLWEESGRSQVVYAYIDYLQSEAEQLSSILSPKAHLFDSTFREALLSYDREKTIAEFNKGSYTCGVCLDAKPGSACHQMYACHHVFCTGCLQDFYNNAIKEGDVASVRCLDPDCGMVGLTAEQRRLVKRKTLHPRELLEIPLTRIQVERFVNLKLKKRIESDKDTVYCPRQWCQAPARSRKYAKFYTLNLEQYPEDDSDDEREPKICASSASEDRLAICSACRYAFCRRCRRLWHGEHVACRLHGDPEDLSAEDKASEEWIRLYTSECPTCLVPCQKREGCNHVICFNCRTHFCYLCSAWLPPGDPYKHFNTLERPCYQRLWDLEEGDLGDEAQPGQRVQFLGARGFENQAVRPQAAQPQPRPA